MNDYLLPCNSYPALAPERQHFSQRSLVRAGAVFSCKDFVTAHGLGKKVFVNVAGFLRVRRSGQAASSKQQAANLLICWMIREYIQNIMVLHKSWPRRDINGTLKAIWMVMKMHWRWL